LKVRGSGNYDTPCSYLRLLTGPDKDHTVTGTDCWAASQLHHSTKRLNY